MADIACPYTLSTGGGNIDFNDGSQDQFYITGIQGLDGAPIRAPVDPVPFGDGGILHTFFKGPRRPVFDGVFLVTSASNQSEIQDKRNELAEDLRLALESILTTTGTLTWTPFGEAQRTLSVKCEIGLECGHDQNFLLATFNFGLVSADSDWS